MKKIIFSLGIALMVFAFGWFCYNRYLAWDVVETMKSRFMMNWMPAIVLIVGYLMILLGNRD